MANSTGMSTPGSSRNLPAFAYGKKHYSLTRSIYWLVVACVLPTVPLGVYLGWSKYQLEQQRVYSASIILARKVSAELDSEFSAIESGLKILATSEYLASGNLKKFHEQARAAVKAQMVYNYYLTDATGRQLLNTLRPFGAGLPVTGTPPALNRVFKEGATVLSDLYTGSDPNRPVVAMGVPVRAKGRIKYSLNVALDPKAFRRILAREELPAEWLLVILDSNATIVARSRSNALFFGQKAVPEVAQVIRAQREASIESRTKEGIPVVASHHRSAIWNWTIAVGVPKSNLDTELVRDMSWLVLTALGVFLVGLRLSVVLAGRLITTVRELNTAAQAICDGKPVSLPEVQFKEAEAVSEALMRASQVMNELQHHAYHDPLTGLANRLLFSEIAQNQLAAAKRELGSLTILAIDLDHLKAVNDTHGHGVGDQLLREAARRLRLNIRDSDVAARMGGDEFIVLLGGADQPTAIEFARRLTAALSQPYDGVDIKVSASMGVATYPQAGNSLDELMQVADQALYEAKRAGKGRYELGVRRDRY